MESCTQRVSSTHTFYTRGIASPERTTASGILVVENQIINMMITSVTGTTTCAVDGSILKPYQYIMRHPIYMCQCEQSTKQTWKHLCSQKPP